MNDTRQVEGPRQVGVRRSRPRQHLLRHASLGLLLLLMMLATSRSVLAGQYGMMVWGQDAPEAASTLIVGSDTVGIGEQISIPLSVSVPIENSLEALTVRVQYDPDVVGYANCVANTTDFDLNICNNDDSDGVPPDSVAFSAIAITGVNGVLLVGEITFTGESAGISELTIVVDAFQDGSGLPPSTMDGTLTVSSGNQPPNIPATPSPADSAIDVPVDGDLAWIGGDPDAGDTVTYDVFLDPMGTAPSTLVCDDIATLTCDPGLLANSTQYEWQVVATDNGGLSTNGPIWSFTTEPASGCPITWQADLTISDSGSRSGVLTFGQGPNATSGLDADCGELTLPPPPPPGVFAIRWLLPDGNASLLDYRADVPGPITWRVQFQPSVSGNFTFSWDPATLPTGSFYLKDEILGTIVNVDMKTQSSASIPGALTTLKIEYSPEVCVNVLIANDWNLVSVPVQASDMSVTALFPDATSPAYAFDQVVGYVTVSTLSVGEGYWLRFDAAHTYSLCGLPVGSNRVPVEQGWNIRGVYDSPVATSQITSDPAGAITSPFYGYESGSGYVSLSTLTPGMGYWVQVSQTGDLVFAAGAAPSLPSVNGSAQPGMLEDDACPPMWQMNLTVSNATLTSQLLMGQSPDSTNLIDPTCGEAPLPPPPPADVPYFRFQMVDLSESSVDFRPRPEGWVVALQSGTGGTPTLSWEPTALPQSGFRLQDPFGGVLFNIDMSTQSSYSLPFPLSSVLIKYVSACSSTQPFNYWEGDLDSNWNNAGNWSANTIPSSVSNVIIPSRGTTRLTAPASAGCLLVEREATLDLNTADLAIFSQFENNGTLVQTRSVTGGLEASAEFFHFVNNQGTTIYRGIDIATTDNLGDVTARLRAIDTANGEFCTSDGPLSPAYAERCFEIAPTNPGSATLTLWAGLDELQGIPVAILSVYRYAGGGVWEKMDVNALTGVNGNFAFATADVPGFSHFLLGDADNAPTAVEFGKISAQTDSFGPLVFLATLVLLIFLTGLAAKRTTMPKKH